MKPILSDIIPRKPRGRLSVLFGVVLGVCTSAAVPLATFHLTQTVQKDARLAGLPIPVETVSATVQPMHETIGASGTIQPSMPVSLTAKVESAVLKVPVDIGDVVRPGTLLVQMDQRLFEANLNSAEDNYQHAHRQLQRLETLMRQKFAAAADVEKARADDAAAREALIRARLALANTRIVSPVPAVVLERQINPGEITKLDQPLIQLGVLDPVMMVAQVSEDKIGSVYLGMHAEIGTDAFPGERFAGTVVKIDSRVNDMTRTFGVYIRISNHDLRLVKGITGYARLEGVHMALAVPSTAVINPVGDRAAVFVMGKNHKVHLRAVRSGVMVEGLTEILAGLKEGDRVVTVGQMGLHDRDLVAANRSASWNGR